MVPKIVWRLMSRQPEDGRTQLHQLVGCIPRRLSQTPGLHDSERDSSVDAGLHAHVNWRATFLSPQQPDSARYTTCSRSPNLGTPHSELRERHPASIPNTGLHALTSVFILCMNILRSATA